jgi:hypothetical protein
VFRAALAAPFLLVGAANRLSCARPTERPVSIAARVMERSAIGPRAAVADQRVRTDVPGLAAYPRARPACGARRRTGQCCEDPDDEDRGGLIDCVRRDADEETAHRVAEVAPEAIHADS